MEEFDLLVTKLWENQTNAEELKALQKLLLDYTRNSLENIVHNLDEVGFNENGQLSQEKVEMILQEVYQKLDIKKRHATRVKRLYRVVAAAACFAGIAFGIWYLAKNRQADNNKAATISAISKAPTLVQVINKTDTIQDIRLQDGSEVELQPASAVSYYQPFADTSRAISLRGVAMFKVAKEKTRPFMVFADDFTTTVLGTEFEINTLLNNSITVKLLSGKVVIKTIKQNINPMADVYLAPGQKFVYNFSTKTETVIGASGMDITRPGAKRAEKGALSFTSLPLNIVFQDLESELGIVIMYDTKAMSEKTFTGRFTKSEGTDKILKEIVEKMGLKIRMDNNVYYIE